MIPSWIILLLKVITGIGAIIAVYLLALVAYAWLHLPARRHHGNVWRDFE